MTLLSLFALNVGRVKGPFLIQMDRRAAEERHLTVEANVRSPFVSSVSSLPKHPLQRPPFCRFCQ